MEKEKEMQDNEILDCRHKKIVEEGEKLIEKKKKTIANKKEIEKKSY